MVDADIDLDEAHTETSVWAAFGDLMSGVLGAFVLILAVALVSQLDLAEQLRAEVQQRERETQRREALERALAGPLAAGRVTLNNGRIGIQGSVLFAPGSDQLHPEGLALLQSLAEPLQTYLAQRDEVLMVSGFTDDRLVRSSGRDKQRKFEDNWELSALRALTVTRTLIQVGLPSSALFAAAFGPEQPVASNADAAGRALNRRVELAPTPRTRRGDAAEPKP
jgi:flagellar motor protein MotB